jgi:hypothetical protein
MLSASSMSELGITIKIGMLDTTIVKNKPLEENNFNLC